MNVRVKEIDKATRDGKVLTIACRDETGGTVMEPLDDRMFWRGRVIMWIDAGAPKDGGKVRKA